MSLRRLVLALSLAVPLAAPAAAHAGGCDRVAAPGGSDRNAGTVDSPKRTAQAVIESLDPGQTGCLRAGAYADEVNGPYVANFHRGGRRGARITLRSYPGERARLRGVVVVSHGADYVTVRDLDLDGRRRQTRDTPIGIQIMARDTVIAGNDITDPRANCMALGSAGWGGAVRPRVLDNHFHDCGTPGSGMFEHAIYAMDTRGGRIAGNLIERSAGYGVHLYGRNRGMRVTGNALSGNGGGIIIAGSGGGVSSHVLVAHNAISGSRQAGLQTYWDGRRGRGNRAVDNCLSGDWIDFGNGGVDAAGNVTTDAALDSGACGDALRSGALALVARAAS